MTKDNKLHIGLTSKQVEEKIKNGQYNGSYKASTKSISTIILSNVFTFFNLVNLFLGFCMFIVGSYRNMLFLGVVLWNIFIGIYQELHAKKIIDKLSLISSPKAKAYRDNELVTIHSDDICIDDIILLEAGNQICSDSIIESGTLFVNENLLTGESNPIEKKCGDTIFSGSFVVSGKARAKVCNVGKDNYANKIVGNAKYIKKPNSEILYATTKIIKIVTACIAPIGIGMFLKNYFIAHKAFDVSMVNTVGAVVGMIPNGLMLLTTCVLAVAVVKLSKKHTLVQELYCIETLARVDVLCLDKTGTITNGTMHLKEELNMNIMSDKELKKALYTFANTISDNNDTINAIRQEYNNTEENIQSDWKLIHETPFTSANKWSKLSFKDNGTFILGAPENVLKEEIKNYNNFIENYLKNGDRVLAFAYANCEDVKDKLPDDIKLLAFLVINEKIRENAAETIEYFHKQNVDLKVISGDNPITVSNIAKQAGIKNAQNYIDARTIKEEDDYKEIVQKYSVFGRVTPEQKLKFIKAIKENGHTVAMTGDGVNDVLALKEADCSIAMQSGSDAARSASQLVLLNSDFSSMPAIVAEGRQSINNLERSATLYLVKTIYSTLLAVIFLFLNLNFPFEPVHLTLMGSLAIGIPSFLLALEPNHNRIEGRFLPNVLKVAAPGGLAVVINIIMAMAACNFLNSNITIYNSTVATYSTFGVSMMILFYICKPFNKLKAGMIAALIGGFILESTMLSNIFLIRKLPFNYIVIVFLLIAISFIIYNITSYFIKKITMLVSKKNKGNTLQH